MKDLLITYIVDDSKPTRELVVNIFKAHNITNYKIFEDFNQLRDALKSEIIPDILVLDYYVGEETAFELIYEVKKVCPDCHLIIMSAVANEDVLIDLINTHMRLTFINKAKPTFGEKLVFYLNEVCDEIVNDREQEKKRVEKEIEEWKVKKEQLHKIKFQIPDAI